MQLSELVDKVASISTVGKSQTTAIMEEVTGRITDLSSKIAEIAKSADDRQADAREKISLVENLLGTLQESLASLGSRLGKVETIAATPQKDEQRVARAFAVAGLKSAIDGGGNFESALALVESLGSDAQATASVRAVCRYWRANYFFIGKHIRGSYLMRLSRRLHLLKIQVRRTNFSQTLGPW